MLVRTAPNEIAHRGLRRIPGKPESRAVSVYFVINSGPMKYVGRKVDIHGI